MYKQGLKLEVQRELIRSRASITILEELINKAIRLDNNLFELKLKEKTYTAQSRLSRLETRRIIDNQNKGRQAFWLN
jgi:hypothetical protein